MQQKEKTAPDGVISIEEYLKKRKRMTQDSNGKKKGNAEKMQSSALLFAELYM